MCEPCLTFAGSAARCHPCAAIAKRHTILRELGAVLIVIMAFAGAYALDRVLTRSHVPPNATIPELRAMLKKDHCDAEAVAYLVRNLKRAGEVDRAHADFDAYVNECGTWRFRSW